ncbi:HpcH/HpaI aldolase/citrate lyase family protein [Sphingomonas profundi]|uniref:HpcH/HpaI aldolase/citrate lyase family protein n=1 Tax=Alterirhizorhabdus profundi TaxID=2681549 RepID=UPI0012E7852F|nr:aldolase/citrate lyase family protein [Sphingomonas profundi]
MSDTVHPRDALFDGEAGLPTIPTCEHFAGSDKLIRKAFDLQRRLGRIFDVTCDCEDGAAAGQEEEHARMVAALIASEENPFDMAGARIHDPDHAACLRDVDLLLEIAGERLAYLTIPKATSFEQLQRVLDHIGSRREALGIVRPIPIHVLIETHGALADVARIAALPAVEVLDFGLMDFVSAHAGAIPASAMRSPGQFDHRLIARAKAQVAAAALGHGAIPAHNVCLDLKNADQVHADARRAREEFGFLRMWSIHPMQIEPIVRAMQPDFTEVETAAAILSAAARASWGPIQHAGELHDRATYRYFWNLLQRAHGAGMTLPEEAAVFFA